jgi:phosphatidylglycerophosphatase A
VSFSDIALYFTLFRLFDIFKPQPIKWIETTLGKNEKTLSIGIMIDDVAAAIFAVIAFVGLKYLLPCE